MDNIMTTTIPVSRQLRKYKELASDNARAAKLSTIIAGIFCAMSIVLAIMLTQSQIRNNSLLEQVHELQDQNKSLTNKLRTANDIAVSVTGEVTILRSNNEVMSRSISGMKSTVDALDSSNAELISENKSLRKELKKFKKRAELYDKYEYAIYDEAGKRTDLTYDQIKTGEQLMKEQGIDPDLLFGIIMTESGGKEKATNNISTARGYGQFLAGSGKYVYEDILNMGKYDHSLAFNGDINIAMTSGYLGYLKNDRHFSAYAAVKAYRGVEPTAYIRRIDSYITRKGNSFAKISANW